MQVTAARQRRPLNHEDASLGLDAGDPQGGSGRDFGQPRSSAARAAIQGGSYHPVAGGRPSPTPQK